MNKTLMFPLTFMFLLTIFSVAYSGATYVGQTQNYSSSGPITIISNETQTGQVNIPHAGTYFFDIWSLSGALIILLAALIAGIIAGIHFFGSGFTDTSQMMIFQGLLFGGLWACLTMVSGQFLFDDGIFLLFWFILTFIYVMGMGSEIASSGD